MLFFFVVLLSYLAKSSSSPRPGAVSTSYWCPGQCNLLNAALCHKNYLFIIGTGRSGSTSLFKALNMIPGVHLCGETGLIPAMNDLYRAMKSSGASQQQLISLLEDQQYLFSMLHPVMPTTQTPLLFGSKEVHVPLDQLDFVQLLFPCSRFVFSYRRDLVAQGNSGFHKKQQTSLVKLSEERVKMLKAHESLGDFQTFLMPLEDLDAERLTALVDWVGFEDCEFKRVGHYNFNNTYRKIKHWPLVRGSCSHRAST
jgi:hypothetical protein